MLNSHMQYIALIHNNADSSPDADEWDRFIDAAISTGMFKGGSEVGARRTIGPKMASKTTESIVGFMRFDSDDPEELHALLKDHPVIQHGGTIELCEMPKS